MNVKKKWFNLMVRGIKKEEFRVFKPYWTSRLEEKFFDQTAYRDFDFVVVSNGYASDRPYFIAVCTKIHSEDAPKRNVDEHGYHLDWDEYCYVISLGQIKFVSNYFLCCHCNRKIEAFYPVYFRDSDEAPHICENCQDSGDSKHFSFYLHHQETKILECHFKKEDKEVYISTLFVDSSYRENGHGSRAFRHVVEQCSDMEMIRLEYTDDSKEFWLKMGLSINGKYAETKISKLLNR